MAVFRQIQINFWQDSFILELTPEEKYFYLYLMTNSKTSQCGIYEIPIQIIEIETGYNRDTVIKLLVRFSEYKKIIYDKETKEIYIINWLKHNNPKSPKIKTCVEKEIKSIKSTKILNLLKLESNKHNYNLQIDTKEEENNENTNYEPTKSKYARELERENPSLYKRPSEHQLRKLREELGE